MWGRSDSQEVGLEAAILERVRNSSLVECRRADNVPGLKPRAEAADRAIGLQHSAVSSWADGGGLRADGSVVGERRAGGEAGGEPTVERARERMPA